MLEAAAPCCAEATPAWAQRQARSTRAIFMGRILYQTVRRTACGTELAASPPLAMPEDDRSFTLLETKMKTLIAVAVAGAFALPMAAQSSPVSDNIQIAQAGGAGGAGGAAGGAAGTGGAAAATCGAAAGTGGAAAGGGAATGAAG